jgi:hypothetical protein
MERTSGDAARQYLAARPAATISHGTRRGRGAGGISTHASHRVRRRRITWIIDRKTTFDCAPTLTDAEVLSFCKVCERARAQPRLHVDRSGSACMA